MDIPLIFRCDECGVDLKAEFVQDYTGNNIIHVKLCACCVEGIIDETRQDMRDWFNSGCRDERGD